MPSRRRPPEPSTWGRCDARHPHVCSRRALAVGLVATLAACANDPLAEQYRSGDNKGFIAADGFRVVEIPADERGEPVVFEGTTEAGDEVSSADYRRRRARRELLVRRVRPVPRGGRRPRRGATRHSMGEDVSFLGINTADAPEAAAAFAETYGVSYPSVMAAQDGAVKLAFAERTPINATPTTLVLDGEGRVAARIIGQLPDASVLTTLVRDALEES